MCVWERERERERESKRERNVRVCARKGGRIEEGYYNMNMSESERERENLRWVTLVYECVGEREREREIER